MSARPLDPTPEQQAVIDTFGQGQAVLAGAGCGKSTTLVAKCIRLLEINPKAKFAAVSFTEKSAEDLRKKLAERIPAYAEKGGRSGHWVNTIHGLCGAILREFPVEAGLDGEEEIISESEQTLIWEQVIDEFWLENVPEAVSQALERFSIRENRVALEALLRRVKSLRSFGALDRLRVSEDPDSRALGVMAEFVITRFDEKKRRQGRLDFDDLELFASRALESAKVRESFHRRFDLVLVDEFQDTNPLQAQIIRQFTRPDRSNLCVVGDPKQSIYRFRDADFTLFEEFCRELPLLHLLTRNFRSVPEILDFANQACAPAFAASQLEYAPLRPSRESAPNAAVERLEVRTERELCDWILRERDQGTRLDEIALLLRKIRGNEKWLIALSHAGIPLSVESGGFFWEDARIHELVAFLKWWIDPQNRLSGAIFLRAPWMGISDAELDAWNLENPHWLSFFKSDHPVAARLRAAKSRTLRPSELLEILVADPEREALLGTAYLGLWHRCEQWSLLGLAFEEVVRECERAIEQGRRDKEWPPPKDQGQLRVLTIHGAKGLEFKTVILVDLAGKERSPNLPSLIWNRNRGAHLVKKDIDGEKIEDDTELAEWKSLERELEVAESKRLFYVAVTRAMDRLILCFPPPKAKPTPPDIRYAIDDWRAWVLAAGWNFAEREEKSPPASTASIASSSVAPSLRSPPIVSTRTRRPERARHSVSEWLMLERCERQYAWTLLRGPEVPVFVDREISEFEEPSVFDQAGLGTEVHAALEVFDPSLRMQRLKEIEARWGSERFQSRPVIEYIEHSPYFSPDLKNGTELWVEGSFEIPIGGETLVGAFDRLVKSESTGWTLIDYKVTRTRKKPEELRERYRKQLAWYAWAVQTLEPQIANEGRQARILNFYPGGVHEVAVDVVLDIADAHAIAEKARELLIAQDGVPSPGRACEYCRFNKLCPEGKENNLTRH